MKRRCVYLLTFLALANYFQITSPACAAAPAVTPTPPAPIAPSHKTPEERRGRTEVTVAPLRLSSRRYDSVCEMENRAFYLPLCTEALVDLNLRTQHLMRKKVQLKRILNMGVRSGLRFATLGFAFISAMIHILHPGSTFVSR